MVGDSLHDVIASAESGVKCALVLWDEYSRQRLIDCKPDYTFYSVKEFSQLIKQTFSDF